jgi:extradiol dioxygenase family protein
MNTFFHLSLPCKDIKQTTNFYQNTIGINIGRTSDNWIDVNLFGHQVTFTQAGKFKFNSPNYIFEGNILPSFHFGIIIESNKWNELYSRLSKLDVEIVNKIHFLIDEKGEHTSFFIKDPDGYMIEFKTFKNKAEVFKAGNS